MTYPGTEDSSDEQLLLRLLFPPEFPAVNTAVFSRFVMLIFFYVNVFKVTFGVVLHVFLQYLRKVYQIVEYSPEILKEKGGQQFVKFSFSDYEKN